MPEISYLNIKDAFSVEWEKNGVIIDPGIGYYVTLNYDLALLNIPQSFNQARFRVKFTHKTSLKSFETTSQNFVLSVTGKINFLKCFMWLGYCFAFNIVKNVSNLQELLFST